MWVKLDEGFADHPKMVALSDSAFRTHVRALCWCGLNQTDGAIPDGYLKLNKIRSKLVHELVTQNLWEKTPNGFAIHDFKAYNPTRAEQEARAEEVSEKRALAGRLGAEARWGPRRKPNGKPDGKVPSETMANDGKTDGKPIAKLCPDPDPERDPDLSKQAKDLKDPPAYVRAREEPANEPESEAEPDEEPAPSTHRSEARPNGASTPPASTPPASPQPPPPPSFEPVRVIGADQRERCERPRVVQELPTTASPQNLEVPHDFEEFASELGLSRQAYLDAVTDWRAKVKPSTHTRLFDVLCRFIESKATRRERSTAGSAPAPVVWRPPPEPPADPNPPPPNPLKLPRRLSHG